MQKYIEPINKILNYELNTDHTTENPEYITYTPKCYLNENELTHSYITRNINTIINDVLNGNVYFK